MIERINHLYLGPPEKILIVEVAPEEEAAAEETTEVTAL